MALDLHVRRFLDRLAAMNPPSALSLRVEQRREALAALLQFAGRGAPEAQRRDLTCPTPAGSVPLRIYSPVDAGSQPLAGLIYLHGGGFVAGSLDSHDAIARWLSKAAGCRVIAVGYRLAPEAPYPAAIEDSVAAAVWVARHAEELGVVAERLGICGDSAGGTLAAAVCQRAVQAGEPRFRCQILLCPIMDFAAQTVSRRELAEGYFVDSATLAHDLKYYLTGDSSPADPGVSPLRAAQLEGLPPSSIHTAEYDPLRDEAALYAERLRNSGVATTYHCHSGMIHLFYGMGALIPYVASAYELIGADIRTMLA
jgi:acetyl esterase/lipase